MRPPRTAAVVFYAALVLTVALAILAPSEYRAGIAVIGAQVAIVAFLRLVLVRDPGASAKRARSARRPRRILPAPASTPSTAAASPPSVRPPSKQTLPRTTFDGALAGHGWAKRERELVANGATPEEAREAVRTERVWVHGEERSHALRTFLIGALALTVGGGLSIWSIATAQAGRHVFLFYGAIGGGLIEIVRGLRQWPARLPPGEPHDRSDR